MNRRVIRRSDKTPEERDDGFNAMEKEEMVENWGFVQCSVLPPTYLFTLQQPDTIVPLMIFIFPFVSCCCCCCCCCVVVLPLELKIISLKHSVARLIRRGSLSLLYFSQTHWLLAKCSQLSLSLSLCLIEKVKKSIFEVFYAEKEIFIFVIFQASISHSLCLSLSLSFSLFIC